MNNYSYFLSVHAGDKMQCIMYNCLCFEVFWIAMKPGTVNCGPWTVDRGTPERRNAGTPERRNAGTPEHRNAEY